MQLWNNVIVAMIVVISVLQISAAGCEPTNPYGTVLPDTEVSGLVAESWIRYYDGTASGFDTAWDMAVDNSGNVYVSGLSYTSTDNVDFCVIKYGNDGDLLWVKYYDSPSQGEDRAWAMTLDEVGNVYVTGESQGNGTDYDYATVMYDSSGREMWAARYNGPGSTDDSAFGIAIDSAGNIYITGVSGTVATNENLNINYDYATVKYNSDGQEIWIARYDGPASGNDHPSAITTDISGNIYVSGSSGNSRDNTAKYDYATVKYNSNGQEIWTARYDGLESGDDFVSKLSFDSSGNIYVTGISVDFNIKNPTHSCDTIKYNSDGEAIWIVRYDSHERHVDYVNAITVDASNNVYITGWVIRESTEADFFVVKYTQMD